MNQTFVRPMNGLNPIELEEFQEAYKVCNGYLGPESTYPETTILVGETGDSKLFQPVQTCYVLGSIGYSSSVSRLQLASAMRQIVLTLAWESRKVGRGDIYFVGGHCDTEAFAAANGFELVEEPVYRLRLKYPKVEVPDGK
jgi:hypothetical protein